MHTTAGFLRDITRHPEFRAGGYDTTFVERVLAERAKADQNHRRGRHV